MEPPSPPYLEKTRFVLGFGRRETRSNTAKFIISKHIDTQFNLIMRHERLSDTTKKELHLVDALNRISGELYDHRRRVFPDRCYHNARSRATHHCTGHPSYPRRLLTRDRVPPVARR